MIEVFWFSFLLLTILHPIGDFLCQTRRRFRCEFLIVLNPLHWLWDSSRFRKHGQFISRSYNQYHPTQDSYIKGQFIEQKFWFWLGIDQLAHVILNIIFAGFLELLFWILMK